MPLIIVCAVVGLLIVIVLILHLKLKQLAKAINSNNKALNETREIVATHHKQLKKLLDK